MSELIGCVHRASKKVPSYQGKSVAMSGCGPGELAALQLVEVFGASKVITIDVRPERLIPVKEFGADTVVNAKDENSIFEFKTRVLTLPLNVREIRGLSKCIRYRP